MKISQRSIFIFAAVFSFMLLLGACSENPTGPTHQNKPGFYLADNGVTVKCPEADIGDTGTVNGVTYTKRTANQINPYTNAATTCTSGITDMSGLFRVFFGVNPDISTWDVSNVTDMSEMFKKARSFNQPIGYWDVSNVKDMSEMFSGAKSFNQSIGKWNVSNVTDMSEMFKNAKSFNQSIGHWDVSNVKSMGLMFSGAQSFNQSIGGWDVSNVTNMSGMFKKAKSFNQPIGHWDVSNVKNMSLMFAGAKSFNQPIGRWDVSSVTDIWMMFHNASSFNQDLSGWCVSAPHAKFATGSPLTDAHMPNWGCTKETVTFAGGNGTKANPYQVANLKQLKIVWKDLNAHYIQIKDIHASATKRIGFIPIGNQINPFTGSYDGKGHTIDGLTISYPSSNNVALFGMLGKSGTIKNVKLEDVDITAKSKIAALVATNNGTIKNSSAKGEVRSSSHTRLFPSRPIYTGETVGGLVAVNNGTITGSHAHVSVLAGSIAGGLVGHNAGKIIDSYATGAVGTDKGIAGGLVGSNEGIIKRSYSSGTVTSGKFPHNQDGGPAGGLVGRNNGQIINCYATGDIRAYVYHTVNTNRLAGGLVAINGENGTIITSYAVGSISLGLTFPFPDSAYGGIAASNYGVIKNSYWEGGSNVVGDNEGTVKNVKGLKPTQMRGPAAKQYMKALDFTNIWETVPSGYPVLRWENK